MVQKSLPPAIDQLAEEFVARIRAGQSPEIDEYAERHPELAEEIRELFPTLRVMEKLAPSEDPQATRVPDRAPKAVQSEFERLGDFRILRELGRGGMGIVYEADQVSLGRRVALKVLPQGPSRDQAARRFDREARAAARLHHTNIVPVFGVGEASGVNYYAMQFIRGPGLDKVIAELRSLRDAATREPADSAAEAEAAPARTAVALISGVFSRPATPADSDTAGRDGNADESITDPAPAQDTAKFCLTDTFPFASLENGHASPSGRQSEYWISVARLGGQCADALQYAHGQGILHRDIKPSNLLLDAQGCLWVTDFGLAKVADEQDLTRTGDVVGTLRYLAPEVFRGQSDARSDVYSLGLTLYELVTLRPAFDAEVRETLLYDLLHNSPPPMHSLNPAIPRDLATIVNKSIERDPAHRYQTAGELAEDLNRFVNDEPIRARRVPLRERLARWCRHNPTLTAVGGVALVLLLALSIGGPLNAVRQAQLREQADDAAARADTEKRNAQDALKKEQAATKSLTAAVGREKAALEKLTASLLENEKTIYQWVQTTKNSQLLKDPRFRPLLKELLRHALAHYRRFIDRHQADQSPAMRERLALALFEVGSISSMSGTSRETLAAYQQARRICEQLVQGSPTSPRYRSLLAGAHQNIGNTYRQSGRLNDALAALRQARDIRTRILQEQPHTRKLLFDLARNHDSIGHVFYEKGDLTAALTEYRKSRKVREQLVRDHASVGNYWSDLALSHKRIGAIHSLQKAFGKAHAEFQRALKIWETLASEHRARVALQSNLAEMHGIIGDLHSDAGKPAEALAAYRRALTIAERLARENPTVAVFQSSVAIQLDRIGALHGRAATTEQALAAFQQAIAVFDRLVRDNPGEPRYRSDLGRGHLNIALLYRKSGNVAASVAHAKQAVLLLAPLHQRIPQSANLRLNLTKAYRCRALALSAAGRHREAAADWRQALKLAEPHERAYHATGLAVALARIGEHAEAQRVIRLAEGARQGEVVFSHAYVYALASAAAADDAMLTLENRRKATEHYALRAMALLEQAASAGVFKSATARRLLVSASELDPLRERMDFRRFCRRWAENSPVFAPRPGQVR